MLEYELLSLNLSTVKKGFETTLSINIYIKLTFKEKERRNNLLSAKTLLKSFYALKTTL